MAENRFRYYINEYALNILFASVLYAGFFGFVFPKIMDGMINYGYELFPEFNITRIDKEKMGDEEVRKKVNELEDILTSMAELDLERNLGNLSEKRMEEYEELLTQLSLYQIEIK